MSDSNDSQVQFDFSDTVAVVTGASSGIGREIARQFAAAGARVVVHYRANQSGAEQTMAELPGSGHVCVSADLTDNEAVAAMLARVLDEVGHIDVLVNNAGIYIAHALPEVSFEAWNHAWMQNVSINLLGAASIAYGVGRHMMDRGRGCIVNVSSRAAARGEPEAPAYAASKAGLNAMSASLARSLGPYGIAVHTVAPGFVATGMAAETLAGPAGDAIRSQSPLGRVARPEEVARAVLFLAARKSQFLTGGILDCNGASYSRP